MTRLLVLTVALTACVDATTTRGALDPTPPSVVPEPEPEPEPDPGPVVPGECTEAYGDDLFERYIEPLVTGGQPVTCNQCHLAGLDLSVYVQDTPCQTMACMVDQGVVDLESPEDSAVLEWILRAEPESSLITEDVIDREHDAFLDWIQWSAVCQDSACGELEDPCSSGTGAAGEPSGPTPLGDCSEADLGARFESDVYVHRDRCAGCHEYGAPYGEGLSPEWLDPAADWDAVLATMYNVIGAGYLDAVDPAASSFLLKPLAEDLGGVPHGGGTKIDELGSPDYVGFLAWITYWADCQP